MPLYLITAPDGEKYVSRFRSKTECCDWAKKFFGAGCRVKQIQDVLES